MEPSNYDNVIEAVVDCIGLWVLTHQNSDHGIAFDIILCMALGRVIKPEDATKYLSLFEKKGELQ